MNLKRRNENVLNALTALWESSVRATHDFLSAAEIEDIRPEVRAGLAQIPVLLVCLSGDEDSSQPLGFIGVEGRKVEMLFVDPDARGRGVGSLLMREAAERTGANEVDVNEQNPQAVGFYEHLGYRVFARSETDDQGRPFPILHLRRGKNA
ncbi:acetyltransferase [Saccharibacillus sp. O16]|nr:acetyltransferase [Saccharibacillus sp. O16]